MNDGPLNVAGVGEVAAVVPYVLGINPQDSLVVFPTRPTTVPIARIDMPRNPREQELAASSMARAYAGRGGQVVLLAYTDRLDLAEGACEQLRARLEPETAVVAAAAVQGDQWVRLDSVDSGAIEQDTRDRFAAEYAFRGHRAPYATEEELKRSFQPAAPLSVEAMQTATEAAREAVASESAAQTERTWMTLAFERFTAIGTPLSEADAARMVCDVRHIGLRDHAWASMDTHNAATHAAFWKDLLTRSPQGAQAPTASLTAFAHWLNGDGIQARVALERVPDEPIYTMARLVNTALEVGLNPKTWSVPPELRPDAVESSIATTQPVSGRERRDPPNLAPNRETPRPVDEGHALSTHHPTTGTSALEKGLHENLDHYDQAHSSGEATQVDLTFRETQLEHE
ncbi:DUF4192 domain-containing protein [Pedococcus sp. P5_B7]